MMFTPHKIGWLWLKSPNLNELSYVCWIKSNYYFILQQYSIDFHYQTIQINSIILKYLKFIDDIFQI